MITDLRALAAHRAFMRFFAAQALVWWGSAGTTVALLFAMLGSDYGIGGAGTLLGARALPSVVFGLIGGVFADRYHRRTIMVICSAVGAAVQACVAAALLTDHATLVLLVCAVLVLGSAQALAASSIYATTPALVPADLIQPAQALMRVVRNASSVIGPAAGGLVVAAAGSGWVIAIDSASALTSTLVLMTVPIVGSAATSSGTWRQLAAGWREVRRRTWLLVCIPAFSLALLAWTAGFGVLAPATVVANGGTSRSWGLVGSMMAVGYLLGSVAGLRWKSRNLTVASVLAQSVTVVPLTAVASNASLPILMVTAGIAGAALDLAGIWWTTALQTGVPADILGRVSSFDYVGSFGLIPFGYLAAPWLQSTLGASQATWLLAAIIAGATGCAALIVLGRESADRRVHDRDIASPADA